MTSSRVSGRQVGTTDSIGRRSLHPGAHQGFALIALLVVLAGLLTAVLIASPQILLGVTVSKEDETRRQLDLLVKAVGGFVGNPDGFLSDVGRLPKSLQELNTTGGTHTLCDAAFNPSTAAYHLVDSGPTDHRGHVYMGWNGPYVKNIFAAGDYLVDAWGQSLQYTCPQTTRPASDPTTNGLALTLRTGQITSAGADGTFGTGDDIKSDQFYDNGHVFLTITTGGSGTPSSITVKLYYPTNGEQTMQATSPTTLDTVEGSQKLMVFQSVPAGIRFIDIEMLPKSESIHLLYHAQIANASTYVLPIN